MPTRRVLVVEDEDDIADAVVEWLREHGEEATRAASLVEARELLAALRPDVVVLDLNLPDGNSELLLDELAGAESAPSVVLMSASQKAPALAVAFDVPLIRKPFDFEGLEKALGAARKPRGATEPPPPST